MIETNNSFSKYCKIYTFDKGYCGVIRIRGGTIFVFFVGSPLSQRKQILKE